MSDEELNEDDDFGLTNLFFVFLNGGFNFEMELGFSAHNFLHLHLKKLSTLLLVLSKTVIYSLMFSV